MCGIAGFFEPVPGSRSDPSVLERMNGALAHRGPDGQGVYYRDGIGLAHTRLAVLDREGGSQPFLSDDGATAVVLNGEIYNHREVREDLIREHGARFRSRSDTEVLLRAYEALGEHCIDRLRGMFAFALWDGRARRLWLARDRIGIKPLYYFWDGRLFVFGSELKALVQHPDAPRAIDPGAVDDYFTFGYVPAPGAILSGARKLEAGHCLRISREGLVDARYWDLDFTSRDDRGPGDVEALLTRLGEAVASELVADVPVGVLLSGGLDSTGVLDFMTARHGGGIPAFSASFPGRHDPDRDHAILAARAYGSPWSETVVAQPTPALMDRLAHDFDEPFADPSAIPTWEVCRAARRRVTVCLTGDGGDETFGGYRRYRVNEARRSLRGLLRTERAPELLAAASRIAPDGSWVPKPLRWRAMLQDASTSPRAGYQKEMTVAAPGVKQVLYGSRFRRELQGRDPYAALRGHFARAADWDSTSQLQYADFKTYLADGILTKVDRASMAHGLEARVPLLDERLVEFMARVPASSKVAWRSGKRLFRAALRGRIPPAILTRRKRGFTPPVARWLEGSSGALFQERVLRGDPFVAAFLDPSGLRRVWEEQRVAARHTQLLWAVLVLECWGRQLF